MLAYSAKFNPSNREGFLYDVRVINPVNYLAFLRHEIGYVKREAITHKRVKKNMEY